MTERCNCQSQQPLIIKIKTVDGSSEWIPQKANPTDVGFDLRARSFVNIYEEDAIESDNFLLEPDARVLIKTGIIIELKPGWEAQIRSRSGLALKKGLFVLNSPGTIDSGYRNEVGVILANNGEQDIELQKGNKVAQMAIAQVPCVKLIHSETIDMDTPRGIDGFGSTE